MASAQKRHGVGLAAGAQGWTEEGELWGLAGCEKGPQETQKEMGKTDYRSGMLQGADGFHLPGDRGWETGLWPRANTQRDCGTKEGSRGHSGLGGGTQHMSKPSCWAHSPAFVFPHSISYSMELIALGHQQVQLVNGAENEPAHSPLWQRG